MKNICLIVAFFISLSVKAQDTVRHVVQRWTIGPQTVVKDSSGKQYAMAEWAGMMRTKKYALRPADPADPHTAFIIGLRNNNSRVIEQGAMLTQNNTQAIPVVHVNAQKTELDAPEPPKPYETTYFTTGQPIASFTAHDINGKKYKLKDLQGKVVVLNFWFIGCPACMQEIPELNKLVADYHDNPDVVFIAIALDSQSKIEQFLKKTPFNYNIIDDGRYYADQYGINLYPTSLIVDKTGIVRFHTAGFYTGQPYWMHKIINESLK